MTWVAGSHHVLGIEHLLGELGDSESSEKGEKMSTNINCDAFFVSIHVGEINDC